MAYGNLPMDAPEKPNKGHEGGACNRRSCQAEPADWYNHGSMSWYCSDCARDIGDDVVNARFEEHGATEPDTNASYYEGRAAETYESLDEEAEDTMAAIRKLGTTDATK